MPLASSSGNLSAASSVSPTDAGRDGNYRESERLGIVRHGELQAGSTRFKESFLPCLAGDFVSR
jgi:hypothetical protein